MTTIQTILPIYNKYSMENKQSDGQKQQTKAVWGDRKTTLRLNVNCVAEQKVKVKEEEEEEKIKV